MLRTLFFLYLFSIGTHAVTFDSQFGSFMEVYPYLDQMSFYRAFNLYPISYGSEFDYPFYGFSTSSPKLPEYKSLPEVKATKILYPELDVRGRSKSGSRLLDALKEVAQSGKRRLNTVMERVKELKVPQIDADCSFINKLPGASLVRKLMSLLQGGYKSVAACIVGQAEGTRTRNCGFTRAYNGHHDPGNYRVNRGSFSRNGTTLSPKEADVEWQARLMARLPNYIKKVKEAALDPFDPVIFFNYIDLYTQAPQAADGWRDRSIGRGFLEGLKNLRGKKVTWDNIVGIRVDSYRNTSGRLETVFSQSGLVRDQQRRVRMLKEGYDAIKNK